MNIRKVKRSTPQRDTFTDNFYISPLWRRNIRPAVLKRDNNLCQVCLRTTGRMTPATVVDHIIPISQGGSKTDLKNLESVCKPCHDSKSSRERKNIRR